MDRKEGRLAYEQITVSPRTSYGLALGEEDWSRGFDNLPPHMHISVALYVLLGLPPGDFLRAVLEGDLYKAARHADVMNQSRLFDYAVFFYNFAPGNCFGSAQIVSKWCTQGGALKVDWSEEIEDARIP